MRRVLFRKLGLGRGPRNSTTARLTGFRLGFDLVPRHSLDFRRHFFTSL